MSTAITHNEIIESVAVTARKTITAVIETMTLQHFSAMQGMAIASKTFCDNCNAS